MKHKSVSWNKGGIWEALEIEGKLGWLPSWPDLSDTLCSGMGLFLGFGTIIRIRISLPGLWRHSYDFVVLDRACVLLQVVWRPLSDLVRQPHSQSECTKGRSDLWVQCGCKGPLGQDQKKKKRKRGRKEGKKEKRKRKEKRKKGIWLLLFLTYKETLDNHPQHTQPSSVPPTLSYEKSITCDCWFRLFVSAAWMSHPCNQRLQPVSNKQAGTWASGDVSSILFETPDLTHPVLFPCPLLRLTMNPIGWPTGDPLVHICSVWSWHTWNTLPMCIK